MSHYSSLVDFINTLPDYNWSSFNCWHLANAVREFYGKKLLPDFSWVATKYPDENQCPKSIVIECLNDTCNETFSLQHLSLLSIVNNSNESILATLVVNKDDSDKFTDLIILHNTQSKRPSVVGLRSLGSRITGIWDYID